MAAKERIELKKDRPWVLCDLLWLFAPNFRAPDLDGKRNQRKSNEFADLAAVGAGGGGKWTRYRFTGNGTQAGGWSPRASATLRGRLPGRAKALKTRACPRCSCPSSPTV